MSETTKVIGDYTWSWSRDDRGRIVVEVWHNASGKTLGITECDTPQAAKWWACKLIAQQSPDDPFGRPDAE